MDDEYSNKQCLSQSSNQNIRFKKCKEESKVKMEILIQYQQKLAQMEENQQYILSINSYEYDKGQQQYKIIYDCSKNSRSLFKYLQQKNLPSDRQNLDLRFKIFDQLLQIAEFLEKKNIIHNNIKPTNLILNKDKLYLTDFGFLESEQCPALFQDELNFQQDLNSEKQRQIYPYLTEKLLNNVREKKWEEIKLRSKADVKKQDQHALTIMMLEIFHSLDILKNQLIDSKLIEQLQIQHLANDACIIIKNLIAKRLSNEPNSIENFIIEPSIPMYKIDKKKLLIREIEDYAQECLIQKHELFDMRILYLYNADELQHKQNSLRGFESKDSQQLEEFQKFQEKIRELLKFYQKIYEANDLQQNRSLEEKFFFLASLDYEIQKINDRTPIYNQLKFMQLCDLKKQLKEFYDEFDNQKLDNLSFNLVEIKKYIPNSVEYLYTFRITQNKLEPTRNFFDQLPSEEFKYYFMKFFSQKFLLNYKFPLKVYKQKNQKNRIYIGWFNSEKQFIGQIIEQGKVEKNQNKVQENFPFNQRKKQPTQNKITPFIHYFHITIDNFSENDEENISKIKSTDPKQSYIYELEYQQFSSFNVIKKYVGSIYENKYKGKGLLYDYEKNVIFDGDWENGKFEKGSLTVIDKDLLAPNSPTKIEGTFMNWLPHGKDIITYFNHSQIHASIGAYKNGNMVGRHEHSIYEKKKNNNVSNDEKNDQKFKEGKRYSQVICCCCFNFIVKYQQGVRKS